MYTSTFPFNTRMMLERLEESWGYRWAWGDCVPNYLRLLPEARWTLDFLLVVLRTAGHRVPSLDARDNLESWPRARKVDRSCLGMTLVMVLLWELVEDDYHESEALDNVEALGSQACNS